MAYAETNALAAKLILSTCSDDDDDGDDALEVFGEYPVGGIARNKVLTVVPLELIDRLLELAVISPCRAVSRHNRSQSASSLALFGQFTF